MRCAFCNIESVGHTVPSIAVARAFAGAGHEVCYLTPGGELPANQLLRKSNLDLDFLPSDGGDEHDAARRTIVAIRNILEKRSIQVLFTGPFYFKGSMAAELCGIHDVRLFPNPYVQTDFSDCPFAELGRAPTHDVHHRQRFDHINDLRSICGLARRPTIEILTSSFANVLLVDASVPHLTVRDESVFVSGPIIDFHSHPESERARIPIPSRLFLSLGSEISATNRGRAFLDGFIAEFASQASAAIRLRAYVGLSPEGRDRYRAQPCTEVLCGLVSQQLEIANADLVISHGGWNTVHEAILFGKPQIVLPFEGHQHLTAEWVSQQHLGISMSPDTFGYSAAVNAIAALGTDATVFRAVHEMAGKFANPGVRQALVRYVEARYARSTSSRPVHIVPHNAASTQPASMPFSPSAPATADSSPLPRTGYARMLITCGVSTIEGLDLAACSGADEVFCGFQDPAEASSFFRVLNRREMPSANLTSLSDLDSFILHAKDLGLRVFVTLNEVFTSAQYGRVSRFLEFLSSRAVDGLIISDFALLLLLSREYRGCFAIHMGTGALSLNARTVGVYRAHGAKRIVLSRKIFTPEIARIAAAFPDMETEAFMESHAYCPNLDGLCNILHNNASCAFEKCEVLETRYPLVRQKELFNWGCKLCALWDYVRLNVTCLKVPFRDRDSTEAGRFVQLIRELESIAATKSKPEFVSLVKERYVGAFGSECPIPADCYLAGTFSG